MRFYMKKYHNNFYYSSWMDTYSSKSVHELLEKNKYLKEVRNKLIEKRNGKH